jgi:hypothetical protein
MRPDRQHLHRHIQPPHFAALKYPDPDDLPRQLLAPSVANVQHDAVFAGLAGLGVGNRAIDAQCAVAFTGLERMPITAETQMVPAARTDRRTFQDRRLAVRADPRRARGA